MSEMTPRQRVLAALNHQEPDRVPLDIGGGTSTTIVVEGYDRLKQRLGIAGETVVMNKPFRLAALDEQVMEYLGSDCRPVVPKPAAHWPALPASEPGTYVDAWGVTRRQVFYGQGCYYWELYRHPLAEATVEDLETYPWPDPTDPGLTAGLAEETRARYEYTPYALVGDGGLKSFWEQAYMLRGLEGLLADLVLNPGFVTALLTKLLEINLAGTARFLDAVGRYIQVFRTADDLATQRGLLMSPKTFRKLLKPFYAKYFAFVKAHTDAKIFYHSCGNVADLIDDLAEMGVDAINPVQVSALAPDGDVAALKDRFGQKITFWGAIDTQRVLPYGSPADVAEEVRRRICELGPGGGLVLAAVHNLQPDVPPENILAMAEAVREYGRYPLCC